MNLVTEIRFDFHFIVSLNYSVDRENQIANEWEDKKNKQNT